MKADWEFNEVRPDGRLADYGDVELKDPSGITTSVLWVVIPYTTAELAKAAMRHAAVCSDLDVHVCLVDIQVVPFPRPLDQPPIDEEFSVQRLQKLVKESGLPGKAAVFYTREW